MQTIYIQGIIYTAAVKINITDAEMTKLYNEV